MWSGQGALCKGDYVIISIARVVLQGTALSFIFVSDLARTFFAPLMVPLLFLVLITACALAYVPASPTNSSQAAIAGGLNITDISKLRLQWYSNGSVFLLRMSASLSKL